METTDLEDGIILSNVVFLSLPWGRQILRTILFPTATTSVPEVTVSKVVLQKSVVAVETDPSLSDIGVVLVLAMVAGGISIRSINLGKQDLDDLPRPTSELWLLLG